MFEVEHILERIHNGFKIHKEPFVLGTFENLLSAQEYDALLQDLQLWSPDPAQNYEKVHAGVEVYDPPKSSVHFKSFIKAMSTMEIRDALFQLLGEKPFGKCGVSLNRDLYHHHLGPHLDCPPRRMTLQLYLPQGEEHLEYGTVFGKKNSQGNFIQEKQIPFKPNTGYAFISDEKTWHSLPVFPQLSRPRHSLLFRWKDLPDL